MIVMGIALSTKRDELDFFAIEGMDRDDRRTCSSTPWL